MVDAKRQLLIVCKIGGGTTKGGFDDASPPALRYLGRANLEPDSEHKTWNSCAINPFRSDSQLRI